MSAKKVLIVDYDDLVKNKDEVLPSIFRFLNLDYQERYADIIQQISLEKSKHLSKQESNAIKELCEAEYLRARALISSSSKPDGC